MTDIAADPPQAPEDATPPSEITRLGDLFSPVSIVFVILCLSGLGMGLAYVFGIPIAGQRLLEGQYYWIFIGLFTAAAMS